MASTTFLAADLVRRRGLAAVMADDGHEVFTAHPHEHSTASGGDVLIVDPSTAGRDRYDGVRALAARSQDFDITVVVSEASLPELVRLRMIEAGARFAVRYGELGATAQAVSTNLLQPPEERRLPTRWAMREMLGMAWDGDLDRFLSIVQEVEETVWIDPGGGGLSRRHVEKLRRAAHDIAGLAPPDPRRFSTSVRAAPLLPEWSSVRNLVRTLLGLGIA